MGYYEDQLAAYQSKIKDLVDPSNIPAARKQISDRLASVYSRFPGDINDILGGQLAGQDAASRYSRDFALKADETASAFDINRRRTLMGQYYNYALDHYNQQGLSLQDSDAAARQWAADQVAMKTAAETSAKSRTSRRAEQDVRNQYATATDALRLDYGNPYEQALMRSLFGLATTAATYGILNGKDKTPKQTVTPHTPVAGEGIDWNYIDNYLPYMRSGNPGGMTAGTGQ